MPGKKRGASSVAVQNATKTLAANIRFASVDEPVSSIVVTSSVPNEGKTFVTIELARALAAGGKSVLILECDMHKRSLAAQLGVHGPHGIYDVLSGEANVEDAVVPTTTQNLYFLDAEPNIPNPTDIISSKRFRGMLQALNTRFSYVVIDTPPIGAFVDAAVLGSMSDATLLVVRENFVRRDDLVAAFTQLKQAGANVIGTVLNCYDADSGSYGYGSYGYYGRYGSEKSASTGAGSAPAGNTAAQPPVSGPQHAASNLKPIESPVAGVSLNSTGQFLVGRHSSVSSPADDEGLS